MNAADNLRAAADAVRAALADYDKEADAIRLGTDQRDKLAAEIESDTAAVSLDDPAALQLLAAKKSKLEIIKMRMPNDEVLPPLVRALRELLQTIQNPLSAYLSPVMEQLRAEVDAELLPHITDVHARIQAVNGNAAVHRLRNIMRCDWRVFSATAEPALTARKVLAEITGLLAGETPWIQP